MCVLCYTDGSDIIQQWGQLDMGALSPGPRGCYEREAQGQPPGQSAVSHPSLSEALRCCVAR